MRWNDFSYFTSLIRLNEWFLSNEPFFYIKKCRNDFLYCHISPKIQWARGPWDRGCRKRYFRPTDWRNGNQQINIGSPDGIKVHHKTSFKVNQEVYISLHGVCNTQNEIDKQEIVDLPFTISVNVIKIKKNNKSNV